MALPPTLVSDYYGLNLRQPDLDFVDVPIDADVPLFVDPSALAVTNTPLGRAATAKISDFFQELLNSIRSAGSAAAARVLEGVSEPNDARLGFSTAQPNGNSVGRRQAQQLAVALSRSRAARTGFIGDLGESELFIRGVGRDKVSDITISVIRDLLVEYTTEQCRYWGIPTTRMPSGRSWDPHSGSWLDRYADLPIVASSKVKRLLLIPKDLVRWDLALTSHDYYDRFVISFLQASPPHAYNRPFQRSSRLPTKKDIRSQYPFSKEYLANFSDQNPDVLIGYREQKLGADRPLRNDEIEITVSGEATGNNSVDSLISELRSLESGRDESGSYERLIKRILEILFYPTLVNPTHQVRVNSGRKIIDLQFSHRPGNDAIERLKNNVRVSSQYVPFECKNYSADPANPELDQLIGRLDEVRGRIGFMVCRSVSDTSLLTARCKDAINSRQGYVFWLNDNDLIRMLEIKRQNGDVWDVVEERIYLVTHS